jgi:molybdate transport system substrate-binding protein
MKLRIRHDAVSVWITLSTVTFRQRAARTWGLTGLLSLALATNLSACSVRPSSPTQPASSSGHASATSITVFAAVPLRPVFALLAGKFQSENPGATVNFDFGTSLELANKLTQGAAADIFASADSAQMDTVAKADLTSSNPVNFASNTLVIVTAPANPKRIHSFADLAKPGLQVAACQSQVPCGAAAQRIEDDSGVHLSPASEESTVSEVLAKVTSGEADAGLVYVTDALKAGDKVSTVKFPESADAVIVYPIAILKHASQPALAQKFVDLVTGTTGQEVLSQAGFAHP